MPEDSSSLIDVRPANSPNAFDLRRVGAHPDYWYPLAWSYELKAGRTLGRRFAGQPIALYRGKCVEVPYLDKGRLPNGVKSYPAHEVDGLIFIFPGDPALAGSRLPTALG